MRVDRRPWALAMLLAACVLTPCAAREPEAGPQPGDPVVASERVAPADEALRDAVRGRLGALDGFDDVEVRVVAGVARLSGQVLSPSLAAEAESLTERTDGIVEVVNDISVIRDPRAIVGPVLADLAERARAFLAWLPLLAVALLVIVAFAWLAGWVGRRNALYRRLSGNRFVQDLLRQIVRAGVFLVGVLVALELLDVTTLVGAVLGAAGVAGIAIGFAFRGVVENFIASALLSLRQPFLPNDHVVIDGEEGKVLRLTPRATILMTLDGNHLRIPNARVFNAVVLNYTRNPRRRFEVRLGVGTEEDLLEAQRIGVETLRSVAGVVGEPEPTARIDEVGDSSVLMRYYGWVDQRAHDFGAVRSEATRRLKMALEDAGMDLPEPIYRLRIREESGQPAPERRDERAVDASAEVLPETRADGTIDAQIERERSESGDDLLSDSARLE